MSPATAPVLPVVEKPAPKKKAAGIAAPTLVAARQSYDAWLLLAIMLLLGLGTVMVYSASIGVAHMRFDDSGLYLRKHLIHILVGMVAMGAAIMVDYHRLKSWVYPILGVTFVMLILLVLGFGINRGHSTRWIGPRWAEFQPSEIAKLAFVIYLAYSLEKKVEKMQVFSIGFLPHVLVCCALIVLCLMQPDLGTCLLLASIMFVLLYVGGTRISYIFAVGFAAMWLAVGYIAHSPNRLGRIAAWLDPWTDRYNTGYHTTNALISLGSGGWFGLGLGEGRQKMGFLTQGWTDFVFASIGEELGFVGCSVVIGIFALLCWRGFVVARHAPDDFGRYLAYGITCLLGGQAAFNMGVAVGLVPTKGLNLPFVSGGGSSMIVTCLAAGILLNISTWCSRPGFKRPVKHKSAKRGTPKRGDKRSGSKPKRPITQRDSGVRVFVRTDGGE